MLGEHREFAQRERQFSLKLVLAVRDSRADEKPEPDQNGGEGNRGDEGDVGVPIRNLEQEVEQHEAERERADDPEDRGQVHDRVVHAGGDFHAGPLEPLGEELRPGSPLEPGA